MRRGCAHGGSPKNQDWGFGMNGQREMEERASFTPGKALPRLSAEFRYLIREQSGHLAVAKCTVVVCI